MSHSVLSRVMTGLSAILVLVACQPGQSEAADVDGNKTALTTEIQQASYRLGFDQAGQLASQTGGVLDLSAFAQGVLDAASGAQAQVPEAQRAALMGALQDAVNSAQTAQFQENIDAGTAYRDEFAGQPGVRKTDSGLLYEVITEGTGAKPALSDTVSTHYHGTLITGEVFDSSVDRGQPASFPVGGVIAGWTEALQMMSVGSKWRLVIPPELAYGDRGAGGMIGPHETLIFEVELLEIR